MQTFTAGAANTVTVDIVARSNGDPITSGTVNVYLKAMTGTNAGKWFKGSDSTWSATLASAGTATHDDDGSWDLSIPSAAWGVGVRYKLKGKESGNLHIPYSETMMEGLSEDTGSNKVEYPVTDSTTGLPISGAHVWVTTDLAGSNVIRDGTSNTLGIYTVYLDSGTYYFWSTCDGYADVGPDTEVIA